MKIIYDINLVLLCSKSRTRMNKTNEWIITPKHGSVGDGVVNATSSVAALVQFLHAFFYNALVVFQLDFDRSFSSGGIPVSSCSKTGPIRDGPYWTSRDLMELSRRNISSLFTVVHLNLSATSLSSAEAYNAIEGNIKILQIRSGKEPVISRKHFIPSH